MSALDDLRAKPWDTQTVLEQMITGGNYGEAKKELAAAELASLRARIERLEHEIKYMLLIFDRGLPEGTIGRHACDDARAALESE